MRDQFNLVWCEEFSVVSTVLYRLHSLFVSTVHCFCWARHHNSVHTPLFHYWYCGLLMRNDLIFWCFIFVEGHGILSKYTDFFDKSSWTSTNWKYKIPKKSANKMPFHCVSTINSTTDFTTTKLDTLHFCLFFLIKSGMYTTHVHMYTN